MRYFNSANGFFSMKEKTLKPSLKINAIFNAVTVISSLLFPLITFPYSSRVVMADGIGQVQFFSSIINYIVLFTSLGIPMYAVREIARVRDNYNELKKTTIEIIILNLILTFIGYIIVSILCYTVAKIKTDVPLFLLLSLTIILNTIGCPWFLKGVEDFKFISIRTLCIQIVSVLWLFTFVHSKEDLLMYASVSVIASAGNNVLCFIRMHKFIDFKNIFQLSLNPWRHLKPSLEIFVFNLITSIYINLDSVMLGFLQDATSVGFYTAATKLSHMVLNVVTSIGTVLLPRLSNLIKNEDYTDFNKLVYKSYRIIWLLGMPMTVGIIIMAPILIHLFSGSTYDPAIQTLRIIAPIIMAIGLSNLFGLQVLYPLDKIKLVTISTSAGACVNFSLNCLLIPLFAQDGAAIATVVAETCVTFVQIVIVKKYINFSLIDKTILSYILASTLMGVICYWVQSQNLTEVVLIIMVPVIGALIYGSMLSLAKDSLFIEIGADIIKPLTRMLKK